MSSSQYRRSRPWHANSRRASSESDPLIREEYIDLGSQRLIALSIFVAIQAYKFYEILIPKNSYSLEMLPMKYLLVEGIYIWMLWAFRIPWLRFSVYFNVLFSVMSFFANALITSTAFSVSGLLLAFWRILFQSEYTLEGTKVKPIDQALVDKESFHGGYTIKILPESTVTWNPYGDYFCVDKETRPVVHVPIKFNTTRPQHIEVLYKDLVNDEETTLQFTKKDVVLFSLDNDVSNPLKGRIPETDSATFYGALPLSSAGIYRVSKVFDEGGHEARVFPRDVFIPECPQASFSSLANKNTHECLAGVDITDIHIEGVAPFTLTYILFSAGKQSVKTLESIQPDQFSSRLINGRIPPYLDSSELREALSPSAVNVSIDTTLSQVGEWKFVLTAVKDGLGNEVSLAHTKKKAGFFDSSHFSSIKSFEHSFIVHPRPQISFRSCSSRNPIILAKNSVNLDFDLSGSVENGPYEIFYDHTNAGDGSVTSGSFTMKKPYDTLKVTSPGTYTLTGISGKYCEGDLKESSACLVYVPPQPDISIDFVPVKDACAGIIGANADVRFSGTPPYRVGYRVLQDGRQVAGKSLRIDQSRYQVELTPDTPGLYRYEFYMYGDDIYGEIQLQEPKFMEIETFALASAKIKGYNAPSKCCSGDSLSFDVELKGLPPFKLAYEVVGPSAMEPVVVEDINSFEYKLDLAPFVKGGVSKLLLLFIEDRRGCRTELEEEASIEVRRERPAASFLSLDGAMTKSTIAGTVVDIPIAANGESPFEITYEFVDSSGEVHERHTTLRAKDSKLSVNEKGIYRLTEVRDSYCPGVVVAKNNQFTVDWYEIPSVKLKSESSVDSNRKNVLAPVCQGSDVTVPLVIEGKPPFVVEYDVKGPERHRNERFYIGTKTAGLKLLTQHPGDYTYTIKGIADAFYDIADVQGKQEQLSFYQSVREVPTASFFRRGSTYRVCANLHDGDSIDESIDFKLTGEAPFTVVLNMLHQQSGKIIKKIVPNIQGHHAQVTSVFKDLSLGKYIVSFDSIIDASGCGNMEFSDAEKVELVAAELPSAAFTDIRTDYCVGERISVPLTGTAPFQVVYEFNGKKQKASTGSPFSRLASLSGNLSLIALSDSASTCSMALNEVIPVVRINDKPTVRIDEKLSNQMIRDGDEASLVFVFTGTPPFSFTYSRSELVGSPPRPKIMETHTVSNIFGNIYTVRTNLPGNYEPVAIEDAFCGAKHI